MPARKKTRASGEAAQPTEATAATFAPLEVPDVAELPDDERAKQTQFAPLGARERKKKVTTND